MESLTKEDFFKIIEKKGFTFSKYSKLGGRIFETKAIHDDWVDGYSIKYFLHFEPTFGIKFYINKYSIGGFTGNQGEIERLFSGTVSTEEELNIVLKCIMFNTKDFAEKE